MDPLTPPRPPTPHNHRELLYLGVIVLFVIALLVAIALLSGGCAVTYDSAHGYRGVIGCINLTGPGFSLSCPEGPLRQPELPDSNKPPGSTGT